MAEVILGRPHTQSVDASLPTTVHVVTVNILYRGVDGLIAIGFVADNPLEVVGIQEAGMSLRFTLIAFGTGGEHR
ncbi:MAG: hypothetical protein OXI79_06335 [Gammaproteobacteria bacterium]|nr:hypothetical protein [Gammaproteobacteria bacterium]